MQTLDTQITRIRRARSLKSKMIRLRRKADRMHPVAAAPLYKQLDILQGELNEIGG